MMPSSQVVYAPNLDVFLKSLKEQPLESSIEYLISCVSYCNSENFYILLADIQKTPQA